MAFQSLLRGIVIQSFSGKLTILPVSSHSTANSLTSSPSAPTSSLVPYALTPLTSLVCHPSLGISTLISALAAQVWSSGLIW